MARFKALLPTTLLLAGIELVGRSECTTSSLTGVMVAFRSPDGSPTHRAKVAKLSGPRAIHSMQYQCCVCYSRPSKLVMARRKEK
jgi:hypothetical protein